MSKLVPVYSASSNLEERATEGRIAALQERGMIARVVRHKKGHLNRVILRWRSGDGTVLARIPSSTKYSFKERLEGGGRVWTLMPLRKLLLHEGIEDVQRMEV